MGSTNVSGFFIVVVVVVLLLPLSPGEEREGTTPCSQATLSPGVGGQSFNDG